MRLSRAFLLTFLTREGTLVFSFLNSVVLARALGAEGVGAYSLVIVSANMLAFAGSMGIHFSNSVLAARDPSRAGLLFTQSVIPVLLLAGPALLVEHWWPSAVEFLFGTLSHRMRLYALGGTGLLVINLNLAAIFFGLQRLKRHSLVSLVVSPGMLLTNLLMVRLKMMSAERALDVWLGWQVFTLVLSSVLLASVAPPTWRLDLRFLGECLKLGARGLTTSIFAWTAHRGTVVMVSHFLGKSALGLYTVALPLAETLQHAPSALGSLLMTKASAGQNSPADVARAIRIHWIVGGAMALTMLLIAPWIFGTFFGPAFSGASTPFRILLAGHYLMGVWSLASGYLSGKLGFPPVVIGLTAVVAAINLGLGLWWTPAYGLPGAATAWSVAAIVTSFAMLWAFRREAGEGLRWKDLVPGPADVTQTLTALRGTAGPR